MAKNKILKKATCTLAAVVLGSTCFGPFTIFADDTNSQPTQKHLDEMIQLYRYAWSQDYIDEEVVHLDISRSEPGGPFWIEHWQRPEGYLAYDINDYDGDGSVELLLLLSDENGAAGTSDLYLQIYEDTSNGVVLASEIKAEASSIAQEVGFTQCFIHRNEEGKLLIGCETWDHMFLTGDGISFGVELFEYQDGILSQAANGLIAGSDPMFWNTAERLSDIGINIRDEAAVESGEEVPSDSLRSSFVFFRSESTMTADPYDESIEWFMGAAENVYRMTFGYTTFTSYSWFPWRNTASSSDDTMQQTEETQAVQQTTAPTTAAVQQTTAVQETQPAQISFSTETRDRADYMYLDMDYDTNEILGYYYLWPNYQNNTYDCYNANGGYVVSVPRQISAELLIQSRLIGANDLPLSGGRAVIIWDSPYGLCVYRGDRSSSGYMLDVEAIKVYMNQVNIPAEMVPNSTKEQ